MYKRQFCPSEYPYDTVTWETSDVRITNQEGKILFEQLGVEFPSTWSETARKVVASKYFYGDIDGKKTRESSLKQLVHRVAWAITRASGLTVNDGFDDFYADMAYLLLHQYYAYNSPVWFNVGLHDVYDTVETGDQRLFAYNPDYKTSIKVDPYRYPQGSACFIVDVKDSIEGIWGTMLESARLFKYGSGVGADWSTLRSTKDILSSGGSPSGPVSFMKVQDVTGGTIKSGGKCLAPYTKVYTAEHGPIEVEKLVDTEFTVLSYHPPAGRVMAKRAQAWKSGRKEVVRVTTDKGVFDTSFDHPFRLASGQAVSAQKLTPGMRLHAHGVYERADGYVEVRERGRHGMRQLLHRMVAQDVLGVEIENISIHHVDEDKFNNATTNLAVMDRAAHAGLHMNKLVSRGEHVFQSEEFKSAGHSVGEKNGMHHSSDFWKSGKAKIYREGKQREMLERSPAILQQSAVVQRYLNTGWEYINEGHDISTPEKYREVYYSKLGRRHRQNWERRLAGFTEHFGGYDSFLAELNANNHTVQSVEVIGKMDVYSVEVYCDTPDNKSPESGHNYMIWSGDSKSGSGVMSFNTRRAAIMQTLRSWHPDIMEFATVKQKEERKAHALIDAGYDPSFNGEAYSTVAFQNVNQSVRLDNDFFAALEKGVPYQLRSPATLKVLDTIPAADLLKAIAEGTWFCGDPGVQYEDTIQAWHTCPYSGSINSSNPCCFVGETLVDTTDGRVRIDSLVGRRDLPMAFAFDTNANDPVIRQINRAWVAGYTKRLVEVVTDKGITLRCTPEHRFLARNGEWIQAQHLKAGTRLRKIARSSIPQRADRRVLYTKEGSGIYEARFIWEEVYGTIPDGHHVHHINGDPTDNRIANLELMEANEHFVMHSAMDSNPRWINADEADLLAVYEELLSRKKKTHKNGNIVTPSRWNTIVRNTGARVPLARGDGRIRGMEWGAFVKTMEAAANTVNDRVREIRFIELDDEIPVYDIEVDGVHNFAVTNREDGPLHTIVVHNSEYMFLDNSACNLASINLVKFRKPDGTFDYEALFRIAVFIIKTMDIVVTMSGYPSASIAENSYKYRPLGLGFANLGALLMSMGIAYDSTEGRDVASLITATMHFGAMYGSVEMAKQYGAFEGYERNRGAVLRVLDKHVSYLDKLVLQHKDAQEALKGLQVAAKEIVRTADVHGIRNSQLTVLAPTGTISFMMDCDTTGIEPDIALVKYKLLAGKGDGIMKIVNGTVAKTLEVLGYAEYQRADILAHIEANDTIEGAKHLHEDHLPIFDCAFKPFNGTRSIHYLGHILMMAACQPFVSGAISKTVNVPEHTTVEEIANIYREGHSLGLKALAIYRENSKRTQPLSTSLKKSAVEGSLVAELYDIDDNPVDVRVVSAEDLEAIYRVVVGYQEAVDKWEEYANTHAEDLVDANIKANQPVRKRLPDDRPSVAHKFSVGGHEGYLHVGMYPDNGRPGEIFIRMSKSGSTMSGMMDAFATAISMALQWGVPLEDLIDKFSHTKFDPSGFTPNPLIRTAESILDYIFRYLDIVFVTKLNALGDGFYSPNKKTPIPEVAVSYSVPAPASMVISPPPDDKPVVAILRNTVARAAGPPCGSCGTLTEPNGSCYRCPGCGSTTGCS